MARNRADEILEEWKMVAHSAPKPTEAPRPRVYRSAVPLGLGAIAVAIALVVGLSLRAGILGPRNNGPVPGASGSGGPKPTATATATATPSPTAAVQTSTAAPSAVAVVPTPTAPPATPTPSASPTATASPSATPTSGQTPTPADISAARQAVTTYVNHLEKGEYAAAWAMLGPEAQHAIGSLAAFTSERSAFFQSAGKTFTVTPQPKNMAPITDWLPGTFGAPIDLHHAVLVEVDYAALAGNNAGFELYIVNPTQSGLKIYNVR